MLCLEKSRKKVLRKLHRIATEIAIPFLNILYQKNIEEYSKLSLKHQPVFIIGAPRTGSTILYQTITNTFDVLYIDNLVSKWYRNIFYGFKLSQKRFGNNAHNCFQSNHGDTSDYSMHAPSECGDFWYRWLPRRKHFIDFEELPKLKRDEIYSSIASVINYYNKPLVFKNLNAGQRLRMLKGIFPEAKFIYVKREPIFTAQSILKAKRKMGVADNQFWSIMPPNVEHLKSLSWVEQIASQVYYIEHQIEEDSKLWREDQWMVINYLELFKDKNEVIRKVKAFVGMNERESYQEPEIKGGDFQSINDDEFDLLKEQIEALYVK